jgi:hypothetical protein
MRMTASWLRSAHGSAEYKAVARLPRLDGELPSDQVVPIFRLLDDSCRSKENPHKSNPQWPRTAPNDLCTSRRQL